MKIFKKIVRFFQPQKTAGLNNLMNMASSMLGNMTKQSQAPAPKEIVQAEEDVDDLD